MDVRRATKQDIPAIRKITLDAYSIYDQKSPLPWYNKKNIGSIKDYEQRYFSKPSFVTFVIEENNEILGFAICSKSIKNAFKLNPLFFIKKKPFFIFDIGISKKAQGKGVGTIFFNYIKKWAKDHKFERIVLNTTANSVAHKWYHKLGFKEIASEVFLEKKI